VLIIGSGNDTDSLIQTHKSISVNLNTKKNSTHNRYKQHFLADSGYSSFGNTAYLKKLGYTPIIKYNKKNTKNVEILKANEFNEYQTKIYKKRTIIESSFGWLKQCACIDRQCQTTLKSYNGLLLLASSIRILKRIIKET